MRFYADGLTHNGLTTSASGRVVKSSAGSFRILYGSTLAEPCLHYWENGPCLHYWEDAERTVSSLLGRRGKKNARTTSGCNGMDERGGGGLGGKMGGWRAWDKWKPPMILYGIPRRRVTKANQSMSERPDLSKIHLTACPQRTPIFLVNHTTTI